MRVDQSDIPGWGDNKTYVGLNTSQQPAAQPSPAPADFKCSAVIYESRGGNTQPPRPDQLSPRLWSDLPLPCRPVHSTAASCPAREGGICCENWEDMQATPLLSSPLYLSHMSRPRLGCDLGWARFNRSNTFCLPQCSLSPRVPPCPRRSPPTVEIFSL